MSTRASEELTFGDACSLLQLSSREVAHLRKQGLLACIHRDGRQIYPRAALQLTACLLALGKRYGWSTETLSWYADLTFASEIGRVVLLPLFDSGTPQPTLLPTSWLEMPHAGIVLRDLEANPEGLEEPIAGLIRALLHVALGPDLFWPNEAALRRSALAPLIAHLEARGHPIVGAASTPESGPSLALLVLAFATLTPPISHELRQIVQATYAKLRGTPSKTVPLEEQERILREQLIAVDKLYAAKATEIHSPLEHYEVSLGTLIAPKRTIALQLKIPARESESALDNILDIIRPYLGTYGARVVQALYEIANDPPYWRNPIVTINTNELLDRLGEKRDARGVHYSRNRARLRDTLNAAHNLEIVGEYTTWEDGVQVRKAVRRSVISLIGATFDFSDTVGITTEDLFLQGLPKAVQVRLNFYDGVRRPDGALGNQYVLMPRLAAPKALPKANYAGTYERLRQYLLYCYRQSHPANATLTLTRETALEKAGITNKNVTRATHTLEKALHRLKAEGILHSFGPIPLRPHETFQCVLNKDALEPL
ncbi:MAG TPA: hypothetical protein VNJ09_09025 [Chthonomonadales bacterium]|nr:hypothetical protein [Chthonomonadales bacterium]